MKNEIKILIFSDTHSLHGKLEFPNDIDISIFAGDAGTYRSPIMNVNGILDFIDWYASVPNIKHKIWISGNHDTSVQAGLVDAKKLSEEKGLIYLQHESCNVEGIEFFGSPYTPTFGVGWAFNVPRYKIKDYWDEIPLSTEILITHGGPEKIGGLNIVEEGHDVGCTELMHVLLNKLPNLKIFCQGHIHEGYGYYEENGKLFINASVLNRDYKLVNKPFIITFNLTEKKVISINT